MNKLLLILIIVLAIVLAVLSVAFIEVKDDLEDVQRRVLTIENGLSSIEQYLEPSYHRYLQGEIAHLWEEMGKLKAGVRY